MDKYLVEILKETNTIIIPGIGALTMTDRSSGEVMFMSFLKHDDGALAKHIAQKEGWDENEAKNLIAKYVREIEAKINTGESYDMFKFGSFRKDNSGDVVFNQYIQGTAVAPEIEIKEEAIKEEVIEEVQVVQQEQVSEIETVAVEPEPEKDETILEETSMQETVVEPEFAVEPIVEEPVSKPEIEANNYSEEQQWNDDLDLPPVNAMVERPKKPILEKAKADKKRRSPMLLFLIIAVVIVLGGATTVVLYGENLGLFMAKEEVKEQVEEELDEDKIDEWYDADETEDSVEEDGEVEDSEDEEAPIVKGAEPIEKKTVVAEMKPLPVEVKKVETVSSVTNGAYHIVAGAFGDVSNAERLVKKLKGIGFSAQVLAQLNGLHIVSAESYASQQEAERALKENGANLPKAWILNKQ